MIRLIGFEAQHGNFTSSDTGEVINWSNRLLRCVTDENLNDNERGLKIVEQKLKTAYVISSLSLKPDSSEEAVNRELEKALNHKIMFNIGLVKGKYEIIGFTVVPEPSKS